MSLVHLQRWLGRRGGEDGNKLGNKEEQLSEALVRVRGLGLGLRVKGLGLGLGSGLRVRG